MCSTCTSALTHRGTLYTNTINLRLCPYLDVGQTLLERLALRVRLRISALDEFRLGKRLLLLDAGRCGAEG